MNEQNNRFKLNKSVFKKIIANGWVYNDCPVTYFGFKNKNGGHEGMKPKHWKADDIYRIVGKVDLSIETPEMKIKRIELDKEIEKKEKHEREIEEKYSEDFAYTKTVRESNGLYENKCRIGIDIKNKIKKFSPIHGGIQVDTYMELSASEVKRQVKKYKEIIDDKNKS